MQTASGRLSKEGQSNRFKCRRVFGIALNMVSSWPALAFLLAAGLVTGLWLGARSYQADSTITASESDKAIVEGARAAIPALQSPTGGFGAPGVNVADLPPAAASASVTGPVILRQAPAAYQVAIANPDGVRLKTIATR
jgi:hypothetical protein